MAGKRGRSAGFVMPEAHRVKISNSNILKRLIEAAEGNLELTATQASVGIALLRKVLPDLSSTTISGDAENPIKAIQEIRHVIVDPKQSRHRDGENI